MHSHAEPAELPCRQCGRPFAAEVWVIVDVTERPDLLARLREGTLHDLRCPACGHTATVNAPLLVFRPGAEPALLFSPARGDPRERDNRERDNRERDNRERDNRERDNRERDNRERDNRERDEEQAAALLGMFRTHLGDAWQEEWLGQGGAEGVVGVAREALPLALSDDPATAAALSAATAPADEVPPAVRRALEGVIAALAAEGVRLDTADDLRRALEARPALKARVEAALAR